MKQLTLDLATIEASLSRLKWEELYHVQSLEVVRMQIKELENSLTRKKCRKG